MYEFTDDCLIHIDEIDNEHRQLFSLLNESIAMVAKTDDVTAIANNLVTKLKDYALNHFAHEEAYMESIHDPELRLQKREHAAFADKNHIAALAAIAAIGAAVRNVFCSVKGNLTIAAVAALYMNLDSIYKHFPILLSFLGALPQTFFAAGLEHFSLKSTISFCYFL